MSRCKKVFIPKPNLPDFTDKAKSYQIVADFLAQKTDKKIIAHLVNKLKEKGDFSEATEAFRTLFRTAPLYERVVWGNPFPMEMHHLGNGDNCYYFEPKSLLREISWVIMGLKPHKEKLVAFVSLRDQVERHILLGNYSDVNQLLAKSIKMFGYSVWYYEMRLTAVGNQRKIEDGISLLTNVNEVYKKEKALGIVPILLQYLYNRSFTNTPLRYDNMVVSSFKRNRDNSNRFDYYLFRLNYHQYAELENLSEVVEMEQIQSAVDRYAMLLNVLRSCYIYHEKLRPAVMRFAKQLYGISADAQLLPLLSLDPKFQLPDSYYDITFISILDNYYTGKYGETARLCQEYLERSPSNLYVIKLYCRSQMFLGNGFQAVTHNSDSLLHKITFNTYKVMVEKEKEEYIERLNTILKNIYGLRIAAQLDQFVKAELREPNNSLMALLSITQFDPFFIRAVEMESDQIEYLKKGLNHIPDSVAIRYRKECVEKNISPDSPVVAYIRDVDTAKITFERGEYEEALKQWRKVFEENSHSIPTSQTAVEYIFRSLVALGTEYRQEAVRFYVNCYMENRSYVSKVATSDFMNELKQSRYAGTRNGLDLMLFVFLNADKYPLKQFVLERYCSYEHVTYPSELISKFKERDLGKAELFFYILLNDDILYHHYKLKSTIDVLDEKLKIVNYLKAKFPENRVYSDIYTELIHEVVAYRGMNKMDDSKIYVNEEAVMKYELCDIEPLYERFRRQAELARKGGTVLLISRINYDEKTACSDFYKETVSYSNDAVADVAVEIYDFIRHAFLKSRFGLGTYLSTRIRHGVFDGEMRTFLERRDLILSTEQGNYIPETHWHHHYHVDRSTCDILNTALKKFSRDTDELISTFKDNVIQIRENDQDPNGGLFCYEQPIEIISAKLINFESQCANAQEFCHKVMDWLWEITEECLVKIRGRVQSELRPTFTNNIKYLESCVECINTHDALKEDLLTDINKAREELNSSLVKVEKWFYRQEAKFEDFKLSDHAHMAFDTANKYSSGVNVNMSVEIPKPEPVFKSQYSASMFDLLSIYFNNIFKYSFDEYERPVTFRVSLEPDDIMHLYLENKLKEGTDEDKLNEKFQSLINEEAMIQKEHGSGLAKAMNIVKYDFGNPANTYTIMAKDGKCYTNVYIHLSNITISPETLDS